MHPSPRRAQQSPLPGPSRNSLRPNCPINGLILVIPADSLIKDNADAIARKASRIAEQLSTIQAALDVRFPVFVLITKTDLINGFREFFEHVRNPRLQHQMLGWSNPDALDQPFRPELVDQYLKEIVGSLSRRRMGLLQDPTPQSDLTGGRRLDEVDAAFALPASLDLLAPRLRRYLEMVFVPNEWSGKPLFLRGIYFTSSMREGSALDMDLAEAIGVPVESLPEGKTWERDRAYFLRDLFLEKIFREKGLVTRASNTKRMLRRRQIILFGMGFAALVGLFAFSWIYSTSLKESVGREKDFWIAASRDWENGALHETWHPIVAPEFAGSANYRFNGAEEIDLGKDKIALADYHGRLAELAKTDIKVPWVFKPLSQLIAGANANRKRAERIVFESSVIWPLVDATRTKVDKARDDWNQRASDALAYLIHLEGMINYRSAGLTTDELSASGFFAPLGNFLYDDPKVDPNLREAFEWNYTGAGDGRGYWPPRWLSGGSSLTDNPYINGGLAAFSSSLKDNQRTQETGFGQLKALSAQVRALRPAEDELFRRVATADAESGAVDSALSSYLQAKAAVDRVQAKIREGKIFPAGAILIYDSYKHLVEEAAKRSQSQLKQLDTELTRFDNSFQDKSRPPYALPAEIRRRLADLQQQLRTNAESTFSPEEIEELQALDRQFLAPTAEDRDKAIYAARAEIYQGIATLVAEGNGTGPAIGSFAKSMEHLKGGVAALLDRAGRYQGGYSAEFGATAKRLLGFAQARRVDMLYTHYLSEFNATVVERCGYPLVRGGTRTINVDELQAIGHLLQSVRQDLQALKANTPDRFASAVERIEKRTQSLGGLTDALIGADGQPANATLSLINYSDERTGIMQELNTDAFTGKFIGTLWRTLKINGRQIRVETPVDEDLVRMAVSGPTLQIEFFKGVDAGTPDRTYAYTADWALLQLLQLPDARAHRLPNGKDWQVMISLKDDLGQDRYLLLRIRFERPLPELENWPNVSDPES